MRRPRPHPKAWVGWPEGLVQKPEMIIESASHQRLPSPQALEGTPLEGVAQQRHRSQVPPGLAAYRLVES